MDTTFDTTSAPDDDDGVTAEWADAIELVIDYRQQLSTLTAERDALLVQRSAVGRRLLDLHSEIRMIEARIQMVFERVARVSYDASQCLLGADGKIPPAEH